MNRPSELTCLIKASLTYNWHVVTRIITQVSEVGNEYTGRKKVTLELKLFAI